MTEAHIISLMPRLRERDVHEVRGIARQETLEEFARERARAVGAHWSLIEDGIVLGCGGILAGATYGSGLMWLLFADGWTRHLMLLARAWRMIKEYGDYRRLEAKCYADNPVACKFVEHCGFEREGVLKSYSVRGEDVVQYGLVLKKGE